MEFRGHSNCRLTRDVELRYSAGANPQAFATFGIACERSFKREGEPEADFFDCVCFGAKAEFVAKYFQKGARIFIEGELHNDNYTNKDGQKVYRNRIYVTNIEFTESRRDDNANTAAPAPAQTPSSTQAQAQAPKASGARTAAKGKPKQPQSQSQDEFMNIPSGIEDELPFLN